MRAYVVCFENVEKLLNTRHRDRAALALEAHKNLLLFARESLHDLRNARQAQHL